MAVLRLLCMAIPIAAQERRLAFSFGKVQMSGNGVSNSPLGQMNSVWNNAGNSLVQPGQQQQQHPQPAGGEDPFGPGGFGGPAPFDDDPFGSFGKTPQKQPSGVAVTPENGAAILRGMIRSFLANEQLQPGEEQCLEQGCSALGSEASAVAQNMVMISQSIMTVNEIGKENSEEKPEDPMKDMMGSLNDLMKGKTQAPAPAPAAVPAAVPPPQTPSSSASSANPFGNFFSGVFGQGTNPSASTGAAPASPQNANVAMNMFNWAQGRRLQMGMGGMGGMGGGSMDPMMMMGGAAMAAQLAKQVKDLGDLTHRVSDKCLQGDAKATFALATKRAKDPAWMEKAMVTQGPAEMGVLADAMTAYKTGDAAGFGSKLGSSLRKILLTDPNNMVPEQLPDKRTLPNVTGGFMRGFFGPGMTATITTPEEPNGINIDLDKCVGKNVGLFQGVWASIMKFYKGQGLPTTEAEKQQQASLLAYFAMQMPRVMQMCNIDEKDLQALKDAAAGMGKGVNFQMHIPSNEYSKSEAMNDMAQTVSGYSKLVQHPSSSVEFGKNLGQVFQNALEGSMSQKYYVDPEGNLRLRQLSTGRAGAQSILTPALLVLVVVLLLLVLLAVKSRRALQGWKEHVCQMECSEAHLQSKAESLDVEASEIKPILDEVQ
mmetsp:Transcript_63919/g.140116  ORF Transcript_63919/g.140116 Transcript_63919/m.140116 type:complete len:655 (+) Transcript_63919:68-2032(+)